MWIIISLATAVYLAGVSLCLKYSKNKTDSNSRISNALLIFLLIIIISGYIIFMNPVNHTFKPGLFDYLVLLSSGLCLYFSNFLSLKAFSTCSDSGYSGMIVAAQALLCAIALILLSGSEFGWLKFILVILLSGVVTLLGRQSQQS